jgi:hypothetical protein
MHFNTTRNSPTACLLPVTYQKHSPPQDPHLCRSSDCPAVRPVFSRLPTKTLSSTRPTLVPFIGLSCRTACLLPVTYQNTLLHKTHTCAVHRIVLPFSALMTFGEYTVWIISLCGCQQLPLLASLLVPNILLTTMLGKAPSLRSSLHLTDPVTFKEKLYSSAYFNICPFDS